GLRARRGAGCAVPRCDRTGLRLPCGGLRLSGGGGDGLWLPGHYLQSVELDRNRRGCSAHRGSRRSGRHRRCHRAARGRQRRATTPGAAGHRARPPLLPAAHGRTDLGSVPHRRRLASVTTAFDPVRGEDIARRLAAQRERIAQAALRAGRDPKTVRLIAVSKGQPAEALRAAYQAGQRDFGENYVQELVAKAEALADLPDLRFHLIGHLQRNKPRTVAGLASAVHSVDSPRLAQELGKRAAARGVPEARRWRPEDGARLPVLAEVNIAGEPGKSGCRPEALGELLAAIEAEPALRLVGLMT